MQDLISQGFLFSPDRVVWIFVLLGSVQLVGLEVLAEISQATVQPANISVLQSPGAADAPDAGVLIRLQVMKISCPSDYPELGTRGAGRQTQHWELL